MFFIVKFVVLLMFVTVGVAIFHVMKKQMAPIKLLISVLVLIIFFFFIGILTGQEIFTGQPKNLEQLKSGKYAVHATDKADNNFRILTKSGAGKGKITVYLPRQQQLPQQPTTNL